VVFQGDFSSFICYTTIAAAAGYLPVAAFGFSGGIAGQHVVGFRK
jgi:hypothetical protein